MYTRFPHNPTPYDDDWEDQPKQGWFYKWVLGVAVPVAIAWYGFRAIVDGSADFSGQGTIHLDGVNAVALGVAALSAAVFVHCHYYWGNIYNQAWFAVLGKILGLCGFIACVGYLLVHVGIFGKG